MLIQGCLEKMNKNLENLTKAFEEGKMLKELRFQYCSFYDVRADTFYNGRSTLNSCPKRAIWMEQIPRFIHSKY